MKKTKKTPRSQPTLSASSGLACTPARPGPTPARTSGSWQSCPACDGNASGSCRTCEGAGVVFAAHPAPAEPAVATSAVPPLAPTPLTALQVLPTMVCAHPQAPPLTSAMRYRVWRQPYGQVDHVSEGSGEQFIVQTASLAEAVQLERMLEAYDQWQDRDGDHDIDCWDGTLWRPGLDTADMATAQDFLQSVYDLDDVVPASIPSSTNRPAGE